MLIYVFKVMLQYYIRIIIFLYQVGVNYIKDIVNLYGTLIWMAAVILE